jgi:tetratricopeptide (TPR) repeat protein
MPFRLLRPLATGALAVVVLGAVAWWALVGTARVAPPPPPAPDDGQEAQLFTTYLERLVQRRPAHWQPRVELASLYSAEGRDEEALRELRFLSKQRPRDLVVLRAMARAAERTGSVDDELRAWTQIARRQPTDIEAWVRLSTLYRQLGWYGPSRSASTVALKIAPKDPEALRVHAIVCYVAQDESTAVQTAQRLVAVDPSNAVGYSILSTCYRDRGQWPQAVEAAEKASRAAPSVMEFRSQLARLYMDRPQGPQYERALEILTAGPPSDSTQELRRQYWLGICRLRMGDLEGALRDLQLVYQRDPAYEEVAFHLSKVYQQQGDARRAEEMAKEYQLVLTRRTALRDAEAAMRRDSRSPELHLNVARAALAARKPSQAIFECRVALRLKPGHPEAGRLLQQALREMGQSGNEAGI